MFVATADAVAGDISFGPGRKGTGRNGEHARQPLGFIAHGERGAAMPSAGLDEGEAIADTGRGFRGFLFFPYSFAPNPWLLLVVGWAGHRAARAPAHTTVNAVVCCGVLWARKSGVFFEKNRGSAFYPGAKAVDWEGIQVQKRLTGRASRCKSG
jgi:hypothetical protein